jgi:hypothetical protein
MDSRLARVRRTWRASLLLAALVVLAGCGGSKPKPLGLQARVLKEGELAGFTCYQNAPKGVPRPPCARALSGLAAIADMGNAFINDPRAARRRLALAKAGIVRGLGEQITPIKGVGGATSLVVQFKSEKDAKDFLAKLFPESFAPCPKKCEVVKTEFHVSGIKGAKGAELQQTVGPATARFRAFRLEFADGPFLYGLAASGALGVVPQDAVVAAARTLYERVKGRPPPGT